MRIMERGDLLEKRVWEVSKRTPFLQLFILLRVVNIYVDSRGLCVLCISNERRARLADIANKVGLLSQGGPVSRSQGFKLRMTSGRGGAEINALLPYCVMVILRHQYQLTFFCGGIIDVFSSFFASFTLNTLFVAISCKKVCEMCILRFSGR